MIRKAWDIKLRLYPLAILQWEKRANCIYGDSEVTYLIPNQIAINRAATAGVQGVTMNGMPIMLVNGDVVTGPISNDPGQVITVYGNSEDMTNAIRYVQSPNASYQFDNVVNALITNTLSQAGANDAALGDMRPDNTSAIIAVREAATMPMQLLQNRFYSFIENIARIWAEFWVSLYGARSLKIEDESGEWYMPFNGEEYRQVLINARVDVGAAGLWSEIQSRQTLDNMLVNQLITPLQYLKRLPHGSVPQLGELIRDTEEAQAAQQAQTPVPSANGKQSMPSVPAEGAEQPNIEQLIAQLLPEYQQAFAAMSPEQQQQVLAQMGMQ